MRDVRSTLNWIEVGGEASIGIPPPEDFSVTLTFESMTLKTYSHCGPSVVVQELSS